MFSCVFVFEVLEHQVVSRVKKCTIGCLYGDLWGNGCGAHTINGAGAGICVLEPRVTHTWVLAR